jgi:hypothetical protein
MIVAISCPRCRGTGKTQSQYTYGNRWFQCGWCGWTWR